MGHSTNDNFNLLSEIESSPNRVMACAKLIFINLMLLVTNSHMKILRESCKQYADFNVVLENMFDSGSALKRVNGKSRRQCLLACTSYSPCKSVNYKNDGGLCDLLDRNLTSNAGVLQQKAEWTYITTDEYSLKVRILSCFLFVRKYLSKVSFGLRHISTLLFSYA